MGVWVAALTSAKTHETDLDMMPPGNGQELKCFELADGRLVCLIAANGFVVEINVCGDADKPKAGRVWMKVEKVKLAPASSR